MNQFKYLNTVIVKSDIDFTRIKSSCKYSGNGQVSTSVGVPKDLEKSRKIRCKVNISIGGDDDRIKLYVDTISYFEILDPINLETLREDANAFCRQTSMVKANEKIAVLTKLHTGKTLNLPMMGIEE